MNSTVIVIDDDKDQVYLLSEILESSGKQVNGIGYNGKEAVELYEKHKPDIVFLDIMMPEYDGFYAIDRIKKIKADAKIIAITGDMSEKTQQKLEANNIPILYKPYDISTIAKVCVE